MSLGPQLVGGPSGLDGRAVLEVRQLDKSFRVHAIDRDIQALRRVDVTVHPGEHVALVGASGAGKSSLLKCVWRSYRPTAGHVWLRHADGSRTDLASAGDREVADIRSREIGYVGQFLRAEPRRCVLDVVGRAGIRRGADPGTAYDQASAALRAVGIGEKLWSTSPVVLSGGEQQRVNLAAGTLHPPRLLLLDEPVASLDSANRDNVLDLVAQLTSQGVGVLSVFHDLGAVRRLATRVVLLRAGQVVAEGPPGEVLDQAAVA